MAGAADFVIRTPIYGSGSKTTYTTVACQATIPSSAQSVLIFTSTVAFVAVGKVASATAGSTDLPLPANAPIIIPIPLNLQTGAPIVVSAIQDSSGGNMFCFAFSD